MDLAAKDLFLAHQLGREFGVPLELAGLVEQIFVRARSQYGGAAQSTPISVWALCAMAALAANPAAAPATAPTIVDNLIASLPNPPPTGAAAVVLLIGPVCNSSDNHPPLRSAHPGERRDLRQASG
jgi:hypothetical protein